jgi:hypothetical protein
MCTVRVLSLCIEPLVDFALVNHVSRVCVWKCLWKCLWSMRKLERTAQDGHAWNCCFCGQSMKNIGREYVLFYQEDTRMRLAMIMSLFILVVCKLLLYANPRKNVNMCVCVCVCVCALPCADHSACVLWCAYLPCCSLPPSLTNIDSLYLPPMYAHSISH